MSPRNLASTGVQKHSPFLSLCDCVREISHVSGFTFQDGRTAAEVERGEIEREIERECPFLSPPDVAKSSTWAWAVQREAFGFGPWICDFGCLTFWPPNRRSCPSPGGSGNVSPGGRSKPLLADSVGYRFEVEKHTGLRTPLKPGPAMGTYAPTRPDLPGCNYFGARTHP